MTKSLVLFIFVHVLILFTLSSDIYFSVSYVCPNSNIRRTK